jgi:hypothetical protein
MSPEERVSNTLYITRIKNLDESICRRIHSTNLSFIFTQNRSS